MPRRGRDAAGRDDWSVHAAAVCFDLHVPESRSLKAKRAAIRPIVDGLRHRFQVSVAEVDHQDQWQRAAIGVAVVGGAAIAAARGARLGRALRRRGAPTSSCSTSRPPGWSASRDAIAAQVPAHRARQRGRCSRCSPTSSSGMSDPRLELVTLTGVDVTRDLAHATVYYSTLGARAADDAPATSPTTPPPRCARRRRTCAASSGRQMRIRQVPRAHVRAPTPASSPGQRIEEILRGDPPREAVGRDRVTAGDDARNRERSRC